MKQDMNEIKLSIKVRWPTYVSSRTKIFSSQLCRVFLNFRARSLSGTLLHIFAPIRETSKLSIWQSRDVSFRPRLVPFVGFPFPELVH